MIVLERGMQGWRTALAWIATALLLSSCQSTKQDVVRIGVAAEPYPPFAIPASGEWTGFEIDLYRAVCEAEKLRCELVEVPWDEIIPALMDRRIDVIWSSMSITDEREAVIDFTEVYYDINNVLIGAASDPTRPSIQDPASLAGKSIGVQESTIFAAFVTEKFGSVADVRMYSTLDDALSALRSGEVDYVSESTISLTPFLSLNTSFTTKAIWPPDPIFGRGVGAGVREEDDALRRKLNRGIATVVKSGQYDDLLRRYSGLSDGVRKPQF
jgi:polar amino acid transport system substrate-binding protein